ncbi:hypothetical protein GQL56_00345 [Pseudomonas putida]|nr:hypothetical protein [Pseudomonas putida]
MSDEQTQDDFLGEIAAQATGSVGVPDDVNYDDAVPDALATDVESYDEHAERRDEHLPADDADEPTPNRQESRQRNVPLGALQEERTKRQAAQAEVLNLQQQLAAFQLQAQQAAQQPQQEEIPPFVDDPEGHLNGLKKQFQNELDTLRQGQQQQQWRAEQAQFAGRAAQLEAEFRQARPDYDAAFQHVNDDAARQIAQMYPGISPEQVASVQAGALLQFAAHALQSGQNPCELVYAKAQQLGFNPAQRASRQPREQAPTSLSSLNGTTRAPDQRGNVGAKNIASMSNAEFDKFFNEMAAGATQRPTY